jgi:hypothetical protein
VLKYRPSIKKELEYRQKGPPPPPARKGPPPPPPPRKHPVGWMDVPFPEATHIEYSGIVNGGHVTIVAPINTCGDYSSFAQGSVRYGKLRYDTDFIPIGEAAETGSVVTARTAEVNTAPKPKVPRPPKVGGEGKCAFIDRLIMEGTRSAVQIANEAAAKFGADPKATLNTVKCRPSHIKAKGLVPPPFKP